MSQAPPPAYEGSSSKTNSTTNMNRMDALKSLAMRHEISRLMALKLRKLEAYDIVVICDDSGSSPRWDSQKPNPFAPTTTRWDELKTHSPNLGKEKKRGLAESGKNLFILIATDGAPTTDYNVEDKRGLWSVLAYERGDTPVAFLACTDDDAEIEYLNDWDVELPNLDGVEDYNTERGPVHRMLQKDCGSVKNEHIWSAFESGSARVASLDDAEEERREQERLRKKGKLESSSALAYL
ncbi:hypothetical protein CcCBS67573_g08753 [Chytriomyces confervae]|uniref:Uncharacterized protein n=1 Tax=Chytriomyces confervae TaxID=246404 RepID=A0A507EHA5_9FUNG|nr:hypothetical protein CcCBS67573_g08753 [Chytriomyces confervae]